MRVILKQDVENLGRKGDIVNVAPGYGRNYLIPKKIALEVTSSNMKMIEIEQQALKKEVEKERASYQTLIEKLNETTLSFRRKTGEKDVIFGSVSSADLKDSLQELGFEIDKKKILLSEPIKRLGNYTVPIKIFHEDRAEVKVEVVKEGEEAPEMKEEEKAPEEKPEEMEEAKAEPEEKPKEEIEAIKEEKEDKEKIEEKEKEAEEEEAAPETEKDEEAVKKEEKEEEEITEEKVEEQVEEKAQEEEEEEETKKQEEASEAKEEAVEDELPEPEGKKEKKEKGKKKEKKKKS
ncbi:MAG: 50S ribosomal protein L9 [Candidatus Aminicenantes bacterium]|nr:MAG: 50S ribosomal protein L9 [Candidatus Aminicenantes bacterium]